MITVYYDGKCGLCAREIDYYRRVAPVDIFVWQDVTQQNPLQHSHGIPLADALRLLHVIDDQGQLHVGVDAFIVIWRQMSGWRLLAAFVGLPIVRQCAGIMYRVFARRRFARLTHCQIAAKEDSTT